MAAKYKISGMMCAGCVANVEDSVKKVKGVTHVNVNLLTNSMEVNYGTNVNDENIIKAVKDAGYEAEVFKSQNIKEIHAERKSELKIVRTKLTISLILLVILMYIAMGPMIGLPLPWPHHAFVLGLSLQLGIVAVISAINYGYFVRGFKTLFKGHPNMDSLTAVGSSAAIIYGIYTLVMTIVSINNDDMTSAAMYAHNVYIETAAMILVFVSLGKYLEEVAKVKTKTSLEKLIGLVPDKGYKLVGDEFIEVSVSEIVVGDKIRVNPGAKIPLDGIIVSGFGDVDESAINGEAAPKYKSIGDEVIGATINRNGSFVFEVSRTGEDTTVRQIIKLVEEAANSKVPLQVLADKIAGIFVPVVMGLALLVFLLWVIFTPTHDVELAFNLAISVLVVSCPCALGLATPVAVMVGTGKGAEQGILVKNAAALSNLNNIDAVIFDKTGTITNGFLKVSQVTINQNELSGLAPNIMGLETLNDHPLAKALVKYLEDEGYTTNSNVTGVYIPGQGMVGEENSVRYLVGNRKLLLDHGLTFSESEEVGTHIYVAKGEEVVGAFILQDDVKPSIHQTLDELKHLGVTTILLTGDNLKTARYIANQVGISEVYAEVVPSEKAEVVARVQSNGKKVAMVGDGINDAPALEVSSVGIAIGSGTQIALESADIILVKDDPYDVIKAIKLAKKVTKTIKWNLFWAFFYNIIMIPLAAGVFNFSVFNYTRLNPMIASGLMAFSSLFVVINALFIKRLNLKGESHESRN